MSTTKDLNLSFAEIGRSLRQPLANSTIAYRGSAMGFSSGRVRPLVSGDDFAGFLTAKSDNRAFAAGADPLPVQLITQGLVEIAVTGVVSTSVGATVYASDENTFNLTSGSTVGTVQVWVKDGIAIVAFEAFAMGGSSGSSAYLGTVADEAAMIALSTAAAGDECYRTDTGTFWKLRVAPYSSAANWTNLGTVIVGAGGGDDVTAWGGFTGGVSGTMPTTVTVNGVTQTIAYVAGTNNVESYTIPLTGAADIVTLIGYDNGYTEASGDIIKGNALEMTAAQLEALQSEVLESAGALANGFKARVTDLFFSTLAASATQLYHEGVLEWQNYRFRPVSGCVFDLQYESTHVNDAAESGALSTVVLPGHLCLAGSIWRTKVIHTSSLGASAALQTFIKVNGSTIISPAGASAVSGTNALELDIHCRSDTSQMYLPQSAAALGSTIASSSAITTSSVNATTTDLTITTTADVGAATDKTITHRLTYVEMLS